MSRWPASRRSRECGFPRILDANEPGAVGLARLPVNARNGDRISTALAYLALAESRSDLTILLQRPGRGVDLGPWRCGWRPAAVREEILGVGGRAFGRFVREPSRC
jgi:hypothetical protein